MSDIIEHNGRSYRVTIERDDCADAPWDREDGHGPVSAWTSSYNGQQSQKRPGELILCDDRGSYRTYDFAEACKIARREGWGAPGDEGMTLRQKAAHAARADFERLRAWCADQWEYVGVVVTALDSDGDDTDEGESLWGIESDSPDYLAEVAHELADQIAWRLDTAMAADIAASRPDMTLNAEI